MKFGIIGCGLISRFHARALQELEEAELVCAFDRSSVRAEAFEAEFGVAGYTDLEEMLGHPGLEAVTICTPSGAHLEPCRAAAAAGKHVLCEKPLEVTLERIAEMEDACRSAGVVLGGILDRRFNPAVEAMREAVEKGRFGRIVICSAAMKWHRTQEYYDQASWRGTWALDGGGALMNQAIHTLDKLLLFGGDVETLVAETAILTHERIEVEDNAVAMLRYKSGALGVVEASTSCWNRDGNPATLTVCGERGTVVLADEHFRTWEFADDDEMDVMVRETMMETGQASLGGSDPAAINHVGHLRNIRDFVRAVESGREPSVSVEAARRPVALVRAIYESASQGSARVWL